jgi:hypothetical protein
VKLPLAVAPQEEHGTHRQRPDTSDAAWLGRVLMPEDTVIDGRIDRPSGGPLRIRSHTPTASFSTPLDKGRSFTLPV